MLTVGVLAAGYFRDNAGEDITQAEISTMFGDFKAEFGKHYVSEAEEVYRINVFKQNVKIILAHNTKKDTTY